MEKSALVLVACGTSERVCLGDVGKHGKSMPWEARCIAHHGTGLGEGSGMLCRRKGRMDQDGGATGVDTLGSGGNGG